jgi:chitin disaccharide deacetylase
VTGRSRMLIVNADDWGRSVEETDVALACFHAGRITSVTAMVFMEDSERAAQIALQENVPAGLHLNFNQAFTRPPSDSVAANDHTRVVRYLRRNRYFQLIYNPLLNRAFANVVRIQIAEFQRLYRRSPSHFDGHQHMHLCMNMLLTHPIPHGSKVRRSFSFRRSEKSSINRAYRAWMTRRLRNYYCTTDYFFALSQNMDNGRFAEACRLAKDSHVEVMTHPIVSSEKEFLNSADCAQSMAGAAKGSYLDLR